MIRFLLLALALAACAPRQAARQPQQSPPDNLDPLGDWESVQANGAPADMYRYLVNDDPSAAQDKAKTLRPSQRDGLTDYILRRCGRTTASWRFALAPQLPGNEKDFVSWYLKQFTSYKPR